MQSVAGNWTFAVVVVSMVTMVIPIGELVVSTVAVVSMAAVVSMSAVVVSVVAVVGSRVVTPVSVGILLYVLDVTIDTSLFSTEGSFAPFEEWDSGAVVVLGGIIQGWWAAAGRDA